MTEEYNFENLCNLATSLLGLRKGSLSNKNRQKKFQIPRCIVANIARIEDEIHQKTIAKVLKRDRSLIYHYEIAHNKYFSTSADYRNTFDKIYNAYQSLMSSKKKFLNLKHLKLHLRDFNVVSSKPYQATIIIESDNLKTNIKVSYRKFYDTLENCKLALQEYKYKIDIK
tara:strand:+ start:412 stop:921 length:510 start_codon:yes stop_codon:yes gene_type:complete